ncbi:MAG: dihydroorotate dehydrogenase, partial [Pirellulales bacterium]|nr:dihydroorotate dehydrogenase [Pirellulales bacterium]
MSSELSTTYLGLTLPSPVIVGSCPLTIDPEAVRQMANCGAGAIVLPSILQEQIEYRTFAGSESPLDGPAPAYQPQHDDYNGGIDQYLKRISEHKALTRVPIIANMNGVKDGVWMEYAKQIQDSGADGIELNVPPAIADSSRSAEQIETELCGMVERLCQTVSIPVAVKLAPYFTNLAKVVRAVQSAGAAGVVLFAHQPMWDVCVDRLHWTTRWELTPVGSTGRTLEGIVRSRMGNSGVSVAASGGVRTSEDAMKSLIAGADAV